MKYIAVILAALFLVACGGGDNPQSSLTSAKAPQAAPTVDAATLMAWAERNYPAYFTGPSQDGVYDIYSYRYYPSTGNYIGIAGDRVHVLGPVSRGVLQYIGTLNNFACQVNPESCGAAPLSAVQQALESTLLGVDKFFYTWSPSERLYRDPPAVARSEGHYFFEGVSMPFSPQTVASRAVQMSSNTSPLSSSLPGVSPAFGGCSIPAGADRRANFYFIVALDENGAMAKLCNSAPQQIEYVGNDAFLRRIANNGSTVTYEKFTAFTSTSVQGQNVVSYFKATYVDSPWNAGLRASAATFPSGAATVLMEMERAFTSVFLNSADGMSAEPESLVGVPVTGSTGFVVPAASIEQAMPYASYGGTTFQLAQGTIQTLRGRRIWMKEIPAGSSNLVGVLGSCLIEMDGKVFYCTYGRSGTRSRRLGINGPAKTGLQAAQLSW